MKTLLRIFVFMGVFPVLGADLVTIRTINGVNIVQKKSIVEGPDGYLKSLFLHSEMQKDFIADDGSVFVYVDDKAMRYALAYIRNGSLPTKNMLSSPFIKKDINFLLPGIKPKSVKAKPKKKKVWECAAYCDYARARRVEFMSTTHVNLKEAWQNLVTLCGQKGQETYLVSQDVHKQDDYKIALASMGGSCVHRTLE